MDDAGDADGADSFTRTRIRGLRDALLYPDDLGRLEALVKTADFMKFHAWGLLGVYANLLGAGAMDGNLVFTLTVIRQALAIVKTPANDNPRISPIMRLAERIYFAGNLLRVRTHTADGLLRRDSPIHADAYY